MSVTRILHPHRVAIVIAAGIALLVFAAAAYGDIAPSTSGRAMVREQEMDVALKKTALGTILVDSRGHTLYMFLKDTDRRSVCTAGCARGLASAPLQREAPRRPRRTPVAAQHYRRDRTADFR